MSRQNHRWSLCSADSLTLKAGWQCPASEEVLLVCRERRWLCPQRLRHCGERKRERGLMRWQDMYLNLNTDQINKYITIYVRRTCIHPVAILYLSCIHLCLQPVDNRFVWRAAKDSLQRCSVVARLCSVPFSVV